MNYCVQLALFILILCSATIVLSQQTPASSRRYEATWESPEFGDISELRGRTKAYVYCEDFKIRQVIVDELRKYPALEIVSNTDEAEFLINFTYRYVTTYSGGIIGGVKTNIHSGDLIVSVAGRVDENNRVHQRIVWSSQNERKTTLGKNPAQKGAQKFLEAYKRVQESGPANQGVSRTRQQVATASSEASNALVGSWRVVATDGQGQPIKEFTFSISQNASQLIGQLTSKDGTPKLSKF